MTYTLTFTDNDLRVLNMALVNQPYKDVVGIIQAINEQINAQTKE
jgi:hypothetical protein